jgi:DNA-directed RNA polymerase specialized sigma24 family protein
MATRSETPDGSGIGLESALSGILALLIDEREERTLGNNSATKTEIVLSQAGLSIEEIAKVTGKKYDTVRMAITRGKKAKSRA